MISTVQTVFSLSDSQAVKLTTARYYTPSGRSIHKDEKAREAAMETAGAPTGEAEADQARVQQAPAHSVKHVDEEALSEGTRPEYHTASGRTVYGGGGITPDVAFEPQTFGELERRLERDGLFFTFAVNYSLKHKVPQNFEVTDDILRQFKDLLKERKFEYEEKDFSGQALDYTKKAILREVVAKNFGRKAMYRVLLEQDPELQKALAIQAKAPTLQAMFTYAEHQRDLKKASLE